MIKFAALVAGLLDKLLDMLVAYRRKVEAKEAQEARDEMEINPGLFFNRHFSGVPQQPASPSTTDETNAPDNTTR